MPWPRLLAADLPAVPPRAQWTPLRAIAGYNNYYEFSTEKEAVRVLAQRLTTSPWHIEIGGLVEKPLTLDLDDLRAQHPEERVYSLRCIEAWSKLVPWQGVPLHRILSLVKPLSAARYVRFTGTYRPSEMINQRRPVLDWPYTEALRIDEAEHPLTLLATGLYGQDLPPANGAPVRLVVPWKYGFKSIKAIQRIDLVAEQPLTTWMKEAPGDFDFYANVNPNLAHPRWNQQRETRLGEPGKRATEMYNGYGEQVAHLYKGR
ncbi:MAG: protein-methionine-sulfoxide reductase catalytic subunit MsrP [Oleiphilaceae bacterium]|nr:protein-methionine-sulfoxide reductase catalytic subunit MsrP [Oleiphilaceae bacterium]